MADHDNSNAQNKNSNGLSSSEIDRQVDYCQTNLKIISQIKVGDKLCFDAETNKFCIDEWSYTQPITRWWSSEGRKPTIKAIEDVISQVFKTIDSVYSSEVTDSYSDVKNTYYTNIANNNAVFHEENSTILLDFINEIRNAIGGLNNLKQTYAKDVATISSLDISIEKLILDRTVNLSHSEKYSKILTIDKNGSWRLSATFAAVGHLNVNGKKAAV